jgi:hypothetical protein
MISVINVCCLNVFVIDGKKKHSRFIVDGGCLDSIKVKGNT